MGEAEHGCETCRYLSFSGGECPCDGCDVGFDRWLPEESAEITALKAERDAARRELFKTRKDEVELRAQAEALTRTLGRVRHHEVSPYVAMLAQLALDEYRENKT